MVKPPLLAYNTENRARLKELLEKPTVSRKKWKLLRKIEKKEYKKIKSFRNLQQ